MSPLEKLALIVSVPPCQRMFMSRRLQAVSTDVPRSAASGADEVYMRRHAFNIFEIPRLILRNNSKDNRDYISGAPTVIRMQLRSDKEDRWDRDALRRACSAALSTFFGCSTIMGWMPASRMCCSPADIVSG